MKLKPTPLFIVSAGLILYGLYMLIFVDPGEEGWGTLIAMTIGAAGVVCLIVYAVLRLTLRSKVWTQVRIEAVLIIAVLFFGYKRSGHYEFDLPHKYRGYVIVVYGVPNAPRLKKPFYSNKVKFKVPSSGIILTASLPDNNYRDPAEFRDSTLGDIYKLPVPLKRHGLPLHRDTIKCGKGHYFYNVWIIKDQPNWSVEEDSINRLDLKFLNVCRMIKQ